MKYIAIIPARYASTRFPGKPLAKLDGKPIIQHVWERVKGSFDATVIATDDERIRETVESFGGRAIMTSPSLPSGTDRCQKAYEQVGEEFDVIVNVQGDEPFIRKEQLEALKHCFDDSATDIATLVQPFAHTATWDEIANPNSPKVVVDGRMMALYFSRSVIPYLRGQAQEKWAQMHTYYKHIGIYGFRAEILRKVTQLPQSALERAESLEQLRWVENGYKIKVACTEQSTIGIDTPEDLERAAALLRTTKAEGNNI